MTSPRLANRLSISDSLADALRVRGYVVTPGGTGANLNVGTKDGYIGTLRFWSIYTDRLGQPSGYVEYEPCVGGDGRYQVSVTGTINLSGLLRRLKADLPKVAAERERRKASAARAKDDAAILDKLWDTLGEDRESDVVGLQVYKGLVDLKLDDITPAQAAAVLVALKAVL